MTLKSTINNQQSCILGIDGGGTKTLCVAMDMRGEVLGRGEGGPSNYQTIGLEAALESIATAIASAVTTVGQISVIGIGLGLAGAGRPQDVETVRGLVDRLSASDRIPVKWCLQADGIVVTSDCAIALVGGTGSELGVVTIAGTGSIAFGCNREGGTKRAGGWGYLLGDEGSGYDIAIQGLRAAVRAYDGRSDPTILSRYFIESLELKNLEEIVEIIYRRGWGVKQIAALAPIVDRAAAVGDPIANEILDNVVEELVLTTQAVSSVLFESDEPFEVVTMGGVWRSVGNLRDRFCESLVGLFPTVRPIWPRHEPAYGAGLLVLERLKKGKSKME